MDDERVSVLPVVEARVVFNFDSLAAQIDGLIVVVASARGATRRLLLGFVAL